MAGMVKGYRIPCRCSAAVLVGPGQAGGVVECPACGTSLDVPRLRDLEPYAVAVKATAERSPRRGSGWFILGAAVAILSAGTAVAVNRYAASVAAELPDEATIRAGVGRADSKTIYEVSKMMRQAGVDRGPLPEEIHAQQTAASTDRITRFLWILAAGGGLMAAAGLVLGLTAPSSAESAGGAPR
jgi:hypothetical protein